jgi:hypothetical protein
MASDRVDIEGKWYGMMAHCPNHGIIHVSFAGEKGSLHGTWDFPGLSRGAAKRGTFTVTRFWNWLHIRIEAEPLASVEFRLTIFAAEDSHNSMITGVIPLESEPVPFATVTLFRHETKVMDGVCPFRDFTPKDLNR